MYKHELLLKARELDGESKFSEVVSLIEEHKDYIESDLEVFALYQKNLSLQLFSDANFDAEEFGLKDIKTPYSDDFMEIFNALPEDVALTIITAIFSEATASIYLTALKTKDSIARAVSQVRIFSNVLSLLGDRAEDYDTLKEHLDTYCTISELYGFQFYSTIRCKVVSWNTKTDENLLRYLAEIFKKETATSAENDIYNAYIEKMHSSQIFPFNEKPDIFGEQLIFDSIKTDKAKQFWKEYFAFAKSVREKEYALYKEKSDTKHPLHCFFHMDKDLQKSFDYVLSRNDELLTKTATQMRIDTGWDKLSISEDKYKTAVEEMEKSYAVLTEPIEKLKYIISYYLKKYLKK